MSQLNGGRAHVTLPEKTKTIAEEILAALSAGRQIAPPSQRPDGLSVPEAYAVTAELRRLRSRNEVWVGRKIGFSNRTIWAEYGVSAPIWGDMYATTVYEAAEVDDGFPLIGLLEPRIEPEIAFGLAAAPKLGMDEAALLGCVAWVAHGFEIVQTLFPGWRFSAADSIAGGGLHGALILGPQHPIESGDADAWLHRLADFEIEILCNEEPIDRGHAANVLDGPLFALRHLVELLAGDGSNPPLARGEIITTGTVTRAFPIASGERWSTRVHGLPLDGVSMRFT